MLQRLGDIAFSTPWMPWGLFGGVAVVAVLMAAVLPPPSYPDVSVAFVGNSMQYYNDFPRFMEALSDGHISQNSCLHGDASLRSITVSGNGMYAIWGGKGTARVYDEDNRIFDYGACTVPQLLFGEDADLDQRYEEGDYGDGADRQLEESDDANDDDFFSFSDGLNPCFMDEYYYTYLKQLYSAEGSPQFDFIVMNDNTRNPARLNTREESLEILEEKYVDWFLESGATPILLCTYAYSTPYRDMGGLGTVAEFTSYTYEGYRLYAELLSDALPPEQQPRIAPVAIAFLVVWEENYSLWERLFHVDQIHASTAGTFLQGCVVHHTIFKRMPLPSVAIRPDMSYLWMNARRFQPGEHRRAPYPTQEEAAYLYDVAVRVCKHNYTPKSFQRFVNGEGVDYTPIDDLFRIDDLF